MSEGFDPQALLAQALEMQQRLMDAQAEAAIEVVQGTSGSGKVVVTMTGAGEVTSVRIDPSVVVAEEVDLLEDLILAALHDAAGKASARAQEGFGGLGDLLGEGGLEGALGGLFGGAGGATGLGAGGGIGGGASGVGGTGGAIDADAIDAGSHPGQLPPGEK